MPFSFLPWFLRRSTSSAVPAATSARERPCLEPLEDRLALNSRFVVPLAQVPDNVTTFHTLNLAMTTPGLASGDVIQIEPGSMPGTITDAAIDGLDVTNVTIRGNLAFQAASLPVIATGNGITVDAQEEGLAFINVNLQLDHSLSYTTNGTFQDSHVVVATAFQGLAMINGTTVVVQNNTFINTGIIGANAAVLLSSADGSTNRVTANTFINAVPASGATMLFLNGLNLTPTADVVAWNTFIGSDGQEPGGFLLQFGIGVNGVTLANNTFRDTTAEQAAVHAFESDNLQILDNTFEMIYDATPQFGALYLAGNAFATTNATVRGNSFRTGVNGRAIELAVSAATEFNILVEANDFLQTPLGVLITAAVGTAEVGDIDLGGGVLGSRGANNFRIFRDPATTTVGAIVLDAGTLDFSAVTIQAQNNIFAVADPETVVRDLAEDPTEANVVTTGALLGGNPAFVQALYVHFLGRPATLANPADGGTWVGLANGGDMVSVANGVVRSPEALNRIVAGLYQDILGRAGEAAGVAGWVSFLQGGGTVEAATVSFYNSPELAARNSLNGAFVTRLYVELLGRDPEAAGFNAWLTALNNGTLTRAAVVQGFVASNEYRTNFVQALYADLLKRSTAPTAVEVNGWVFSNLDLLTLQTAFASSAEYQANG